MNIYAFYNYIVFVHSDARISDIYMRITGMGKGYYIPDDNEISWNYLKQTYCLAEINNNRIVVNEIRIPESYRNGPPLIAKSYQFQRFMNERSVATDDSYFARENGQIVDVDFSHIKLFRNQTLHKLIEQTPDYNFKLPGARSKLKSQDSKQKSSLQ